MKHGVYLSLLFCWGFLLFFVSCGSKTVSLDEIDVYPGAVGLKAGESRIGDTLAKNVKAHEDLAERMGPLAASTQLDQRGFQLPQDATWNKVKEFYEENLKKAGWSEGLGGVAGKFVDVNKMMNTGGNENSMTHSILFSRGNQRLTISMTLSNTINREKILIFSLTTT